MCVTLAQSSRALVLGREFTPRNQGATNSVHIRTERTFRSSRPRSRSEARPPRLHADVSRRERRRESSRSGCRGRPPCHQGRRAPPAATTGAVADAPLRPGINPVNRLPSRRSMDQNPEWDLSPDSAFRPECPSDGRTGDLTRSPRSLSPVAHVRVHRPAEPPQRAPACREHSVLPSSLLLSLGASTPRAVLRERLSRPRRAAPGPRGRPRFRHLYRGSG